MRLPAIAFAVAAAAGQAAAAPVAVELFTSQSCSSCPPAEAFFREIAARPDVVALEWHVDYWDRLVAGAAGRWKDPFSAAAHTARQRAYNVALRGEAGVYTPQIVVGGRAEAVGSDRAAVARLISASAPTAPTGVAIAAGRETFTVSHAPPGAVATMVRFRTSVATRVAAGENRGRDLGEAHVVVGATELGPVREGAALATPSLSAGEGCALLVSDARTRAVLAAAYCPASL